MPSIRKQTSKSGETYYEIRVRISRDRPELTTRWYVPQGWSEKSIERELAKRSAEFERQCKNGEYISKRELREKQEQEAREAAAILTVKQYGNTVFMPAKEITCSENTRSSFQGMLDNHVYPAIGDIKITEVTSAQITALLLKLQSSGKSHATAVKLYTILNLLFKMAYLNDSIEKNPMDKVQRPKPRKDEGKNTEVEAYTVSELRYIISCLDKEPLKWRTLIRLLIDSGIRRGECCGLQWKYVDFQRNTITVAGNLCYTKDAGVYLDTPKNGKTRTIDVDPEIMQMLRCMQQEQASSGISKFVFTQDDSCEPMHPQSPTHYMTVFSKKYGIENLHPHKLRHSFASVAIVNGADIASVSEKLGHSDKSTTLRLYTHADEESVRRAGSIFRDALRDEKQA